MFGCGRGLQDALYQAENTALREKIKRCRVDYKDFASARRSSKGGITEMIYSANAVCGSCVVASLEGKKG